MSGLDIGRAALLTATLLSTTIGCDRNETPTPDSSSVAAPSPRQDAPVGSGAAGRDDLKGGYQVDPAHSVVLFSTKHAGVSYTHGRFNKVTGKLTIADDAGKSAVEIEIDAGSIFTGVKKRDQHLQSPDFLNAKQFPTISFKSKQIKAAGEDRFAVSGELTLHGVTRPVTVTMEKVGAGVFPMDKSFRVGFEGSFTIKRSDYEMKNMLDVVGDEVRLTIAVEGTRE